MSPSDVEVLLHCHTTPTRHPRFSAPAVADALAAFVAAGVIQDDGNDTYSTTDLGAAWVKAITRVPIPSVAYLDSHGKPL